MFAYALLSISNSFIKTYIEKPFASYCYLPIFFFNLLWGKAVMEAIERSFKYIIIEYY